MPKAEPRANKALWHGTAQPADLLNLSRCDFGIPITLTLEPTVVAGAQARSICMSVVLPTGNPLKIFGNVVRFVSVNVVNLKCRILDCWTKSVGNKPMNHKLLVSSVTLKRDSQIPTANTSGLQNLPWSSATSPTGASYPTERAYLVGPIIHGFPYLHVIDFLNVTANGQPVINFSRGIERND